jgi:hypothetical protein
MASLRCYISPSMSLGPRPILRDMLIYLVSWIDIPIRQGPLVWGARSNILALVVDELCSALSFMVVSLGFFLK